MRIALVALAIATIAACSVTPEQMNRMPAHGMQASSGVGDALYSYEWSPKTMVDQFHGTSTNMDGSPAMRQELLYSGMSNGQLQFAYREFAENLARPAFTQEATYDYQPGGEVTFKGARITVLQADNQSIAYVVESGFSNERTDVSE